MCVCVRFVLLGSHRSQTGNNTLPQTVAVGLATGVMVFFFTFAFDFLQI